MNFYHRPHRVLLLDNTHSPPSLHTSNGSRSHEKFDTNMVIILAVLLCALIFALGINSIVRCILRCTNRGASSPATAEVNHPRYQKGLNKSELKEIRVLIYGSDRDPVGSTECPICLSEFVGGERIRVLPKCAHCFHVRCVDVWLGSNSSCPTCRRSVVNVAALEAGSGGGGGEAEEAG